MKSNRILFTATLILSVVCFVFSNRENHQVTQTIQTAGLFPTDEKKPVVVKVNYGSYNFSYTLLNGKKVSLSDFGGKIVLVNIWAPWCGPCKLETPGFVKLYEKYKEIGFEIVSVGVSTDEDAVKDFVKKYKITFPVGISDEVGTQYGTRGIPDNFLFSPDGKLVKHFSGYTEEKKLETAINELLTPKPSKQ